MKLNSKRVIDAAGYGLAGLAIIYLTVSLILGLNNETAEHAFGVLSEKNRMLPAFADLRAITALAACKADLTLVMEGVSAGCDPYGRSGGLGYPPLIYELARAVGVTGSWTGPTAVVCGITLIAVVLVDSQRDSCRRGQQAMIAGVLLLSFPAQLALERMNIDVIIFIGLRIVAWLRDENRGQERWTWVKTGTATLLVAGLGGSKIYPSIAVLAWLAADSTLNKRVRITDCMIAAGALAGIAMSAAWMLSGDTYAVPPISLTSHGLIVGRNGEPLGAGQTFVSIGAMVTGYWGTRKQGQRRDKLGDEKDLIHTNAHSQEERGSDNWALLALMTWITSYCLTTSFDYRLIFLFPLLIKLASEATHGARWNGNPSVYVIACGIAASYLYVPIVYMWIESTQESTLATSDWIVSNTLVAGRYAVGGLSRLLDLVGLPYLAGISVGYVLGLGRGDKIRRWRSVSH